MATDLLGASTSHAAPPPPLLAHADPTAGQDARFPVAAVRTRRRVATPTQEIAMTRRLVAVAAALVVVGCSTTGSKVGKTEQLRQKGGLCSVVTPDMFTKITSCAVVGTPGTLADDGKTPFLMTGVAGPANSPSADTGSWQVEVFRGDKLAGKWMMKKNWPPELNCVISPCSSWSISLDPVPFEWTPGTYTFRYTLSFDTAKVATNTISIF